MSPTFRIGSNRTTARIEGQAAAWIVRRDGGLTPAEGRAMEAWLAADPRHAQALTRLDATWGTLNAPRLAHRGEAMLAEADRIEIRQRRQRRWRHAIWAATSLAAAAAVAVFLGPAASPPAVAASTVLIRPDRQILADGSAIELAAGAEVAIDFSALHRAVRLVRGQALFTVAKDATRPFVVSAGAVAVRAVGTEFAVRLAADEIAVLVTKGQVAVEAPSTGDAADSGAPAPALVSAGNRLLVPATGEAATTLAPQPIDAGEMAQALAWRSHRVEFTATPLAEAVALMNRQNERQLILDDEATARLQITGVFWTTDPPGFARLLEKSLGVKATALADGGIVISP